MANFVLIHGAFHGGWCWAEVANRLRAAGHTVYAPSLTGLADRSHLATNDVTLGTHVLDVANLIRWERLTDVVLCGHSYGGMVIAGAVEQLHPGSVSSIVFLDAILPIDGYALIDYPPPQNAEGKGFEPSIVDGLVHPPGIAAFGLDQRYAALVQDRITPQPVGTFTEKLALSGAYDSVPKKFYVLCDAGEGLTYLHQCAERARSRAGWVVETIPGGHDIMIEAPDLVAELLHRASL